MKNEIYLTKDEAADYLGLSVETLRKHLWKRSKSPLPKIRKVGRGGQAAWAWTRAELKAWDTTRHPHGYDLEDCITPQVFYNEHLEDSVRLGEIVVLTMAGEQLLNCFPNEKNTREYIARLKTQYGVEYDDLIWNNTKLRVINL